jgi:hypothetical protein
LNKINEILSGITLAVFLCVAINKYTYINSKFI